MHAHTYSHIYIVIMKICLSVSLFVPASPQHPKTLVEWRNRHKPTLVHI